MEGGLWSRHWLGCRIVCFCALKVNPAMHAACSSRLCIARLTTLVGEAFLSVVNMRMRKATCHGGYNGRIKWGFFCDAALGAPFRCDKMTSATRKQDKITAPKAVGCSRWVAANGGVLPGARLQMLPKFGHKTIIKRNPDHKMARRHPGLVFVGSRAADQTR